MSIVLSVTGPPDRPGLRTILACDSENSCLHVGYCSEISHELRIPNGPCWSCVLWQIVDASGVPHEGYAGPARGSAEEILAVLQGYVAKRGPWWLVESMVGSGLQWTACGPRGATWQIAWQPGRLAERNVRAWRHSTGRTGHLGHAETAQEARAEALRIADLIRTGKKN